MKKILRTALLLLAVIAILAVPVSAEDSSKDRIIATSGYGESVTTPDKVTISFAVTTEDPDVQKAQSENANRIAKVIAALKAAGIEDKNIKTTGYSIYSWKVSEYQTGAWPNGTEVYTVTNSVQIISYDISKAGSYIDTAVANGANRVNNLQFGLSDEKQKTERQNALYSAVMAARADADAVASALNVRISGTGAVQIDQSRYSVSYTNTAMDMAVKAAGAPAAETSIESGELKTTATVSIAYTY